MLTCGRPNIVSDISHCIHLKEFTYVWCGVVFGDVQESYVEQFRRILLAKNAYDSEEHGE